jgi:hypothetical protein
VLLTALRKVTKGGLSVFKKLLTWKNNDSDKANARSGVVFSKNSEMKSKKNNSDSPYKWDDWANRSGIHQKLPENQKVYLDKVLNKLEMEVLDS